MRNVKSQNFRFANENIPMIMNTYKLIVVMKTLYVARQHCKEW